MPIKFPQNTTANICFTLSARPALSCLAVISGCPRPFNRRNSNLSNPPSSLHHLYCANMSSKLRCASRRQIATALERKASSGRKAQLTDHFRRKILENSKALLRYERGCCRRNGRPSISCRTTAARDPKRMSFQGAAYKSNEFETNRT